jgi:hypothetical protein
VLAGRHPARVSALLDQWGYSAKSSGGLLALAALKKFGLVEDHGSREAREVSLTDLGRELLFYWGDRESDAFITRAQKAALTPAIHRELWERYQGDLPDDRVILPHLVFESDFSESAAADLLGEFRRTLAFSRLTGDGGNVSPEGPDTSEETEPVLPTPTLERPEEKVDEPPKPTTDSKGGVEGAPRTVQVTYSPTDWALLQARFPMSEDDWEAMLETLNGMKRGLVIHRRQPPTD